MGFKTLIVLRMDLALISPLLPLVCITYQWRLDITTLSWSTTIMRPTPLVTKNSSRVVPMTPSPMDRTNNDRTLLWPNTLNPYEIRRWWDYRNI